MVYDYVITKPPLDEDTLAHYGVIGMKWGVRKNPAMAYGKSVAKLNKLKKRANVTAAKRMARSTKKSARYSKKALKAQKRYVKALNRPFTSKDRLNELMINKERTQAKALNYQTKAAKRTKQASKATLRTGKWEKAMNKNFKGMDRNKLLVEYNEQMKKKRKKV